MSNAEVASPARIGAAHAIVLVSRPKMEAPNHSLPVKREASRTTPNDTTGSKMRRDARSALLALALPRRVLGIAALTPNDFATLDAW